MNKIITASACLCLSAASFAVTQSQITVPNHSYSMNQNTNAFNDDKSVNLRLNVPGLFVGWLGGAADFKVNQAITVGPTAKYFAYGTDTGYAVGMEMNYALNGHVFSDGWLVNPYVEYYHSDYNNSSTESTGVAGANLGYQWMWPNGLNLELAGGLVYSTVKLPVGVGGDDHIHPNLDFAIGYAF